jgi:PhoH-like ATPase
MTTKFYDTNAVLELQDEIFNEYFCISSETLYELEEIKSSGKKDENTKYLARQVSRMLLENKDKYKVIHVDDLILSIVDEYNIPSTSDNLICACAKSIAKGGVDIEFVSYDVLCNLTARDIFGLNVSNVACKNNIQTYTGYIEHTFETDNDMAMFYENINENTLNLLVNQYAILKSPDGVVVDTIKWNGEKNVALSTKNFKSSMFGIIKPKPNDSYQSMVFDSLINNDITVICGKAGSGKTLLSLAYIMNQLDTNKFDKVNVIHSFETLKGAKTLGFVKGTQFEKLTNTSSIGNLLASKFGDFQGLERLMACGILNIVPTANIRGVEYNSSSIVYVSETQDIDTYTLKTILQRCADGCKVILEGDILQSDINRVSGLYKMIDVFKGYEKFGMVCLKNTYRSKACELADLME